VLHAASTLKFIGLSRIVGPQDVTWFMSSLSCLYLWKFVDLCLMFQPCSNISTISFSYWKINI